MNASILYLATSDGAIIVRSGNRWRAERPLDLRATADDDNIHASIARDPRRPECVFYGLPEQGIWRSNDSGVTWQEVFRGLPYDRATALAISAASTVYVGTEPSGLFISKNSGETWQQSEGMEKLPSAKQWSFPPRPNSHHTCWIQPDPRSPEKLFLAVEAGALISTLDGGQTWRDAAPESPFDTHQLAVHPDLPQHIWSAAGDGVFESRDGGETWRKAERGLRFRYGWSVAVDPGDPRIHVLSAAPGPGQAHMLGHAESALFRREGDGQWEEIRTGLPEPKGSLAAVVASHTAESGVFYAAINSAVYRSDEAGRSWQSLPIDWPAEFTSSRIHAMTVASE
jgi:photosystem II stability/assembly factor-like uncharacterized protein